MRFDRPSMKIQVCFIGFSANTYDNPLDYIARHYAIRIENNVKLTIIERKLRDYFTFGQMFQ